MDTLRNQSTSRMDIKNYTSSIPVETTVARIEQKLAAAGANGIMKLFDPKGRISSMSFRIELGGATYAFRLPCNAQSCFDAMWKDYCIRVFRPREETKATLMDQAQRTAWKLIQDWVEVQVSMIVMKQAEFREVFMPYLWDGKITYFEHVKAGGFKALPQSTGQSQH